MTVKLAYLLRQRSTLTTKEFQREWRENHGPLVASLQTVLNLTKYVQAHRLPGKEDDSLRTSRPYLCVQNEPPYDILDEYYFEGSVEDLMSKLRTPEGKQAWETLIKDEKKYIEFGQSQMFFVQEVPQILPGPLDTLMASGFNHIIRAIALAEMPEWGLDHWQNRHGPLIRRWATTMGYEKYVQNHPYQDPAVADLRLEREMPGTARYSWYTNIWVNTRVVHDEKTRDALDEILEDENSGFMRAGSMSCFLGKEYIFVDRYRH
jgi:hypothetical protein